MNGTPNENVDALDRRCDDLQKQIDELRKLSMRKPEPPKKPEKKSDGRK